MPMVGKLMEAMQSKDSLGTTSANPPVADAMAQLSLRARCVTRASTKDRTLSGLAPAPLCRQDALNDAHP
jgi:hypothetical protein